MTELSCQECASGHALYRCQDCEMELCKECMLDHADAEDLGLGHDEFENL